MTTAEIFMLFYPYTNVCMHRILMTFAGSVEKNLGPTTRMGFKPMTFAKLEQTAENVVSSSNQIK